MPRTGEPFRVRAIYGRPLVKRAVDEKTIGKVKKAALEIIGDEAIEQIKKEIRESSWKGSPNALLESFEYEVQESQIIIRSDHPAAKYIDKGVEAYQMTHLTKASKPIPIITDQGALIFRWATEQSMDDGKWHHPGIKGKNFVERGVEQARKKVKNEVRTYVKDEMVGELKRRANKHAKNRTGKELFQD